MSHLFHSIYFNSSPALPAGRLRIYDDLPLSYGREGGRPQADVG